MIYESENTRETYNYVALSIKIFGRVLLTIVEYRINLYINERRLICRCAAAARPIDMCLLISRQGCNFHVQFPRIKWHQKRHRPIT